MVGIGTLSAVVLTPPFFADPSPLAWGGLALVALGHAAILAMLWRGWRSGWGSLLVAAVTVAGLVAAVTAMTPIPEQAEVWWPRPILVTVPAFLIISHRRGWTLAATLIAVNAVLHTIAWQPSRDLPGLSRGAEIAAELGQLSAYALIAFLSAREAISAADKADAAVAATRAMRQQSADQQAASTQSHEADRFVHDEVLHTLRMIAMDRAVVSVAVAQEAARRLRHLVELHRQAPVDGGLVEDLRATTSDAGIAVDFRGAPGISVPRDVSAALVAAVRECVRNAAKHSGADRVSIEVRQGELGLAIRVSDAGVGFDAASAGQRLGLRESVLGRLADIGGSARIASSAGRGTHVSLRWSPIPQSDYAPQEFGGGAARELFPSLVWVIAPTFLQGLWAAAFLSSVLRWPWVGLLATVALVGVGLTALLRGVSHGMRRWQATALAAMAWACTLLAVMNLPNAAPHPRLLWLAVTAGAVPSVLSLFRPLWEAITAGIGVTVITVLALELHHHGAPLGPYITVLLSPLIAVGIAIVVRRHVAQCAFEIWCHEEFRRDRQSGFSSGETFVSRVRQRLEGTAETLVPLLDDVIAQPELLLQDSVRERADQLERGLRDVIASTVDPQLVAVLSRLRLAGWAVRTRWSDDVPVPVQILTADALALLPTARGDIDADAAVTVTASRQGEGWRVSVLVRPARNAIAAAFKSAPPWRVHSDKGVHAIALVGADGRPTGGE